MAENSSATKKNKTAADLMSELAALLENDEKKKKEKREAIGLCFFNDAQLQGSMFIFQNVNSNVSQDVQCPRNLKIKPQLVQKMLIMILI